MFIEFSVSHHFLKFTLSEFVRGIIAGRGHSTSCAQGTAILLGLSLATTIQGSLDVLFLGYQMHSYKHWFTSQLCHKFTSLKIASQQSGNSCSISPCPKNKDSAVTV